MKIYTGQGDEGMTTLGSGERVRKASRRIEAYGTVDELNAFIGTIRPTGHDGVDDRLTRVQNLLHVVQAELAYSDPQDDSPRICSEHVQTVETWIDEFDDHLEPLQKFILPGGSRSGASLHFARTVCRRAERRIVDLDDHHAVNPDTIRFMNRLSDMLFVFARYVNKCDGVREEHPTY